MVVVMKSIYLASGKLSSRLERHNRSGFSLLELLTIVAITTFMAGGVFFTVQAVQENARTTQAVQAARQLAQAYLTTAADRDGKLLPGYDRTVGELYDSQGRLHAGPTAWRYPWRLAPYLDNRIEGTLLLSDTLRKIDAGDSYAVSAYPSFGINYLFVGGNVQPDGITDFAADCVTRAVHASQPSRLLVFASAKANHTSGDVIHGFNQIIPPHTTSQMWAEGPYYDEARAADYGYLDPRYRDKVVAVFMGGNAGLHTVDELRDMRFWSEQAIRKDDPGYFIPRPPRPGNGRR